MTERILYTADQHGNMTQYRAVFDYAVDQGIKTIVFGGDLTPKDPARRTPEKQRAFLKDELFPLIKDHSAITTCLMMGNDDYISNYQFYIKSQSEYGFHAIDHGAFETDQGHILQGYSYVPPTPFKDKDWERRDLERHLNVADDRPDAVATGLIAQDDELIDYDLSENFIQQSIERDLNVFSKLDQSKLILVSHAPPHNTVNDCIMLNGEIHHVGSMALRQYIEKHQPLLTLHGHIHETVAVSGEYQQSIDKTVVASPGNDHRTDFVWVLDIEISDIIGIDRKKLHI